MINWSDLIARRLHLDEDPESHTELDEFTFHPSSAGRCKRTIVKSKFGLEDHDTETLGAFRVGTIIHNWIESNIDLETHGIEYEKEVTLEREPGIRFRGRCDVWDPYEDAVFDFKTRSSWYKFNPPNDAHITQLAIYMAALNADYGQIVYISKKNLEVKTYPEDGYWWFDEDRIEEAVDKCLDIAAWVQEDGFPESLEDIPFEKCGCFVCDQEADE